MPRGAMRSCRNKGDPPSAGTRPGAAPRVGQGAAGSHGAACTPPAPSAGRGCTLRPARTAAGSVGSSKPHSGRPPRGEKPAHSRLYAPYPRIKKPPPSPRVGICPAPSPSPRCPSGWRSPRVFLAAGGSGGAGGVPRGLERGGRWTRAAPGAATAPHACPGPAAFPRGRFTRRGGARP